MKKLIWILWGLLSVSIASYFLYTLLASEDKSELLIGDTSHGHYQIELACNSCHIDAFGGTEVLQQACMNCHADELEQAHDSHPKKKFIDPREAYRLEIIDARYCISCHTEHQEEQAHPMGVTLPDDYCYHCHEDVIEDRESHKDLAFDSCASSGCHNFHDNRALYEDFLVKNANKPWLDQTAKMLAANNASSNFQHYKESFAPTNELVRKGIKALNQKKSAENKDVTDSWTHTSHAQASVECSDCHTNGKNQLWIDKPNHEQCINCHQQESEGFFAGKHGMRLSPDVDAKLDAIRPIESHLEFNENAHNAQQGCNSCHNAHEFNTQFASVDACLQCHNDTHSKAFLSSPHGNLWKQASLLEIDESQAVSCATCHLPRIEKATSGIKVDKGNTESNNFSKSLQNKTSVIVEHNQNFYLRPNEKMIRPVCMKCHSLSFSIDALADQLLIENNFSGQPSKHIPSIDWALERDKR